MTKAFHRRARTSGPRQQLLGLSSRIARRLLAWSLVVGGVGSIILSTWDLMSELEHRVEETHQTFDAATISVVPALVQSIWTFDAEQIRLHTEGLARFPYVDEVQTRLADATTLRAGFTSAGDEVIERTVALTYQDAGHLHDLGTLILIHDLAADRQLLYRQWGLTFIRNAAFILLIALTVTFVYQTVVTRRLIDITSGMRNVGADDLRQREPALGSPRPDTARDELDELAESIELLWRTGGEALRMADLSEQELIRHRDHLEELVDEQVHDLDSARRDAERARQMLQKVLDTIPVRVFWKDTDSRFLGCNRLFALDAGFEHSHDLVGRSDHDMGWRSEAESYRADDAAVMRENTRINSSASSVLSRPRNRSGCRLAAIA